MLLHYVLQALFVLVGLVAVLAAVFNWDWLFTAHNSRFIVAPAGRRRARLFYAAIGLLMMATGLFFACCLLSACTDTRAQDASGSSLPRQCRELFQQGRRQQRARDFETALQTFRQCVRFDSSDPKTAAELYPIVDEALLQLMNTYQSAGQPEACADTLAALCARPTGLIHRYLRSDLYSLLGYALSRTERMAEAELWTDSALAVPQYQPTPQRIFRQYAYAAAVFFSNPQRQEEVIDYCRKALEQANNAPNVSGGGFVASMLGTLYKRVGKVNEAVNLFMKSIEKSKEHRDTLSYISICQSMADLCLYWDLPDYAGIYASYAIEAQTRFTAISPMMKAQSFFLKGQSFIAEHDSALHYFYEGERICRPLPYNAGQVDADLLIGGRLVLASHSPDSIHEGKQRLWEVTRHGTTVNRAQAYYWLAKCLLQQGDSRQAESLLDSMYRLLNSSPAPVFLKEANKVALEHFLQTGDDEQIRRYAAALLQEQRQDSEALPSQEMAGDILRIVNAQREREHQLQQELAERKAQIGSILTITLFITIILLTILFRRKYQIQRLQQQALEARLNALIEKVEQEHRLSQQATAPTASAVPTGPTTTGTDDGSTRPDVEESAIPSVFKTEGERFFRQRFTQLYPNFLFNLRRTVPNINPREELLCMLIVLEQSIDQTSSILGIARTSVTQARYRLRIKMSLGRNDSLDAVVKSLVNEKGESPTEHLRDGEAE